MLYQPLFCDFITEKQIFFRYIKKWINALLKTINQSLHLI